MQDFDLEHVMIPSADVKQMAKWGFTDKELAGDNHCFRKKVLDGLHIEIWYNANTDHHKTGRWTAVIEYGMGIDTSRTYGDNVKTARAAYASALSMLNVFAGKLMVAVDKMSQELAGFSSL